MRAPGRVLLRATMVKHGHALDYGDGVPYTFYAPPVVELFEPDSGPERGGTLRWSGCSWRPCQYRETSCRHG